MSIDEHNAAMEHMTRKANDIRRDAHKLSEALQAEQAAHAKTREALSILACEAIEECWVVHEHEGRDAKEALKALADLAADLLDGKLPASPDGESAE